MFNNAYKLMDKQRPSYHNFVNKGGVVANGKLVIVTGHYIVFLDIASRCLDPEQDLSLMEGKVFTFNTLKMLHKKSLWIADITAEGIEVDDKGRRFFIKYDGEVIEGDVMSGGELRLFGNGGGADGVDICALPNLNVVMGEGKALQASFGFNADYLATITSTFKPTEGVPHYRIEFNPDHQMMILNNRGEDYTDYALLMQVLLK